MFDSAMRGEAEKRLQIQNDLYRALEREELRVHYQPVIDLGSGAIVGACGGSTPTEACSHRVNSSPLPRTAP